MIVGCRGWTWGKHLPPYEAVLPAAPPATYPRRFGLVQVGDSTHGGHVWVVVDLLTGLVVRTAEAWTYAQQVATELNGIANNINPWARYDWPEWEKP